MATVAKQIKAYLVENKHEIAKNLETLTLKKLKQDIAQELSIDEAQVKEHKALISDTIDKIVKWAEKRAEKKRAAGDEENTSPSTKKSKVADGKKPKSKADDTKKPKSKPAATDSAVQKLKDMCKDATITIPPALYKRASDTTELVHELESLLGKHGLSRTSGAREIASVKSKLTKERELEGIDMDNIITEPGRRRRTAAAPVDYKKMAASSTSDEDSDNDDDDDDDDDDSEDDGNSDNDSGAGSAQEESAHEGTDDEDAEDMVTEKKKKETTPAKAQKPGKAATTRKSSSKKTAKAKPSSKSPRAPPSSSKKKSKAPSSISKGDGVAGNKGTPHMESEEDASSGEEMSESPEQPKQRKPGAKRVVIDSSDDE